MISDANKNNTSKNSNEGIVATAKNKKNQQLPEHESIYIPSDSSDESSNNHITIDKHENSNFKTNDSESKSNHKPQNLLKKLVVKGSGGDEPAPSSSTTQTNYLNTKVINFASGFKIPKRNRLVEIF